MNRYNIRIQMLNATGEDLNKLDAEMAKNAGLSTEKKQLNKNEVPRAIEYSYCGKMILPELSKAVSNAAQKTEKKFSFTVIKEKSLVAGSLS